MGVGGRADVKEGVLHSRVLTLALLDSFHFYFDLILDIETSYKSNTEFLCIPHPASPYINILPTV